MSMVYVLSMLSISLILVSLMHEQDVLLYQAQSTCLKNLQGLYLRQGTRAYQKALVAQQEKKAIVPSTAIQK